MFFLEFKIKEKKYQTYFFKSWIWIVDSGPGCGDWRISRKVGIFSAKKLRKIDNKTIREINNMIIWKRRRKRKELIWILIDRKKTFCVQVSRLWRERFLFERRSLQVWSRHRCSCSRGTCAAVNISIISAGYCRIFGRISTWKKDYERKNAPI